MKLKFRVWNGETFISPDYITRAGFAHWKENSIPESSDKIELFTGLLDSKGRECYDGDIAINGIWGRINIFWYQPEAKFVFEDEHGNMEDFTETVALDSEVIGNIHSSE